MFVAAVGVVLAGLPSLMTHTASAAPGDAPTRESILISPTSKRYTLDAGTSQRDTVTVINDGTTAFSFVVYARPYSVSDTSYTPNFVSEAQNADAYKWVQFDKASYSIEAGKSVEIGYTVKVPKNATPGGHYGVLFAETQPDTASGSAAITRKKRVGSILYANVKGDVTTQGSYKGAQVPFLQFNHPLTIRSTVANSGNVDFTATSSVRVSDVFGGLKYKSDKQVAILPQKPRQIINDWENPAWIGLYKVDQTTSFLDTKKISSSYVLLVPIWVYMTLALLIGGRILYAVAAHRRRR